MITKVVIDGSINRIEEGAFLNYSDLKDFCFNSSSSRITLSQAPIIQGDNINIHINRTLQSSYTAGLAFSSPFSSCTNPTLTFGAGYFDIGTNAFARTKFTSLNIPECDLIHNYAFGGCDKLVNVNLGSTAVIENRAFYNCDKLESISLPSGLTRMEDNSFEGCSKLKYVFCHSTTPLSIGSSVFNYGTENIRTLYVPDGCASSYKNSLTWNAQFKNIEEMHKDGQSNILDGVEWNYDNKTLTLNLGSRTVGAAMMNKIKYDEGLDQDSTTIGTIVLDGEYNKIWGKTFQNYPNLAILNIEGTGGNLQLENQQAFTSSPNFCLNLHRNIYSVGTGFFQNSGLDSVNIGDEVTNIGDYAFAAAYNLKSVEIPDNVQNIGNNAFRSCSGLTSVVIGAGLINVANWAFEYCSNLTSVTCKAVTPPSIGTDTFNGAEKIQILYVPAESVELYRASDWSTFCTSNIQQIIE